MKVNDEIRDLVCKNATTAMVRLAAKQSGMVPLKDYSIRLVGEGLTTADEVVRVTLSDTSGEEKLCGKCRNPISDEFIKCPFCQNDLKVSCLRCGMLQQEDWQSCPKCGRSNLESDNEFCCGACDAEIFGDWHICPYCQTTRPNNMRERHTHVD